MRILYGFLALFLSLPVWAGEDGLIAKVDGVEIRKSELERARVASPKLADVPVSLSYPLLLENLVNEKLFIKEARTQKLDGEPEFQKRLKEVENRLLAQYMVTKTLREKITPKALEARYQEFLKNEWRPEEEVKAKHILLDSEAEARDTLNEIKKGKSFEEIAKARSKDSAAGNGGDLGYFNPRFMAPEFAQALAQMKKGETSKEPVKTAFGWHIIKKENTRQSKQPSFAEAQEEVTAALSQEVLSTLVRDLSGKAEIIRYNLDGTPAAKPVAQ